jgi:hypothetical protein
MPQSFLAHLLSTASITKVEQQAFLPSNHRRILAGKLQAYTASTALATIGAT